MKEGGTLKDRVLKLYHQDKWQEIVELNPDNEQPETTKLLWVWPDFENLTYIHQTLLDHGLKGITSLGCGCGLLEWIIHRATGLPVVGWEINKEWWTSKYSNPHFIKLNFTEENDLTIDLNEDYALLFCYFNNGPAFLNYLKLYKGNLIFIIGPGEGRHTDPQPFNPDFGSEIWYLISYQQIKETIDYIAVYVRY